MIGEFTTKDNKTCAVKIGTGTTTIGAYNDDKTSGIFFAANPVIIKQNIDNTFTEIVKTTCEIKLLTTTFHSDLFTNNDRGQEVTVTVDNVLKFKGYVTPNTYSQPYAEHLTELTIQCQDYLSTLENHKYKESVIKNDKDLFTTVKNAAANVSFADILDDMGIDYTDLNVEYSIWNYWNWENGNILEDLHISEHILLGDSVDDVMTCEEILQEICKFLDVHAVMLSDTIYFFDWQTKQTENTSNFSNAVCLNDTSISIAEVYNQLTLKCDVKDEDQVIDSPTSDDSTYSDFKTKILHETEYWSWGEGKDAHNAFNNIIQSKATDYDAAECTDYYLQSMKVKNWIFNMDSQINSSMSQHTVANTMNTTPYKCAMFSIGKLDREIKKLSDDEPVSKIDMSNYIYISMPGSIHPNTDGWTAYNQNVSLSQQQLDTGSGDYLAKYIGNTNGGALGAPDNATKNYFVFSGKIMLKTPYNKTGETAPISTEYNDNLVMHHRFDLSKNGDGCLYGAKFYNDNGTVYNGNSMRLYNSKFNMNMNRGYNDTVFGLTEYTSASGVDEISKVPVLKCYMSIGDYELIETSYNVYEWVHKTDKTKTNCLYSNNGVGDDSTYIEAHKYDHIFTLGFNPAINSRIFNTEYKIANTISYTMNVDGEGTAIPLPTGITGKITFKILAPVATVWTANVCVRQPSFWHHSQWADRTCEIMPFVDYIILKDLECKLASNDGDRTNYEEQDLVYVAGKTDNLLGIKDDIEFKFNTALTTAQSIVAGQNSGAKLSNVIMDDKPFTGFEDEDDKAEIRYITNYYNEYSVPRIIVETTLKTSNTSGYWENFTIPTLSGKFEVLAMEMDIQENKTKYTLKQYGN